MINIQHYIVLYGYLFTEQFEGMFSDSCDLGCLLGGLAAKEPDAARAVSFECAIDESNLAS